MGVDRLDLSSGGRAVRMLKIPTRVDTGPPIDSSIEGIREADGSGLKLLLGPKSKILLCARKRLALKINTYGSSDTTLTVTFWTQLSGWRTKGKIADPRIRMQQAPPACAKLP